MSSEYGPTRSFYSQEDYQHTIKNAFVYKREKIMKLIESQLDNSSTLIDIVSDSFLTLDKVLESFISSKKETYGSLYKGHLVTKLLNGYLFRRFKKTGRIYW